jgi:hypothetical protein
MKKYGNVKRGGNSMQNHAKRPKADSDSMMREDIHHEINTCYEKNTVSSGGEPPERGINGKSR